MDEQEPAYGLRTPTLLRGHVASGRLASGLKCTTVNTTHAHLGGGLGEYSNHFQPKNLKSSRVAQSTFHVRPSMRKPSEARAGAARVGVASVVKLQSVTTRRPGHSDVVVEDRKSANEGTYWYSAKVTKRLQARHSPIRFHAVPASMDLWVGQARVRQTGHLGQARDAAAKTKRFWHDLAVAVKRNCHALMRRHVATERQLR